MANELEAKDVDLLRQLYSQVLKQTATVLSTILRSKTQITLQDINVLALDEVALRYPQQQAVIKFNISNDIQGQGILAFPQNLSLVLCDISMGRDGRNPPAQMGQSELSVFSQLAGQYLTALSTALSQLLNKKINLANPDLRLSTLSSEAPAAFDANLPVVAIISKLALENISEEQFIQIIPLGVAKEIVSSAGIKISKSGQKIEPLSLSSLDKTMVSPSSDLGSLLVDIPLQLSVELGRTKMPLRDVLELGVGSIIELDHLSGEPVDIMLNNKPLAKGEVVIIDENLGVRLTHIINPNERV